MNINDFITDFQKIDSADTLIAFATRHGLESEDLSGQPLSQVLAIYRGVIDDREVKITHDWYDRCRAFTIQPDGNNVQLEVDGEKTALVKFLDDN